MTLQNLKRDARRKMLTSTSKFCNNDKFNQKGLENRTLDSVARDR
jgi:hypothetical protein